MHLCRASRPGPQSTGPVRQATNRPCMLPAKADRSCRKIPQAACHQAGIEFPGERRAQRLRGRGGAEFRHLFFDRGYAMTLPRRDFLRLAAGAAVLPALSRSATADDYPSKPVRILVGYAAGGTTDTLARMIGQRLADSSSWSRPARAPRPTSRPRRSYGRRRTAIPCSSQHRRTRSTRRSTSG
jgi:hypothetical protein